MNNIFIKIIFLLILNKFDYIFCALKRGIIEYKNKYQQKRDYKFEENLIDIINNLIEEKGISYVFGFIEEHFQNIYYLLKIISNNNRENLIYEFKKEYVKDIVEKQLHVFLYIKTKQENLTSFYIINEYLSELNDNIIIYKNNLLINNPFKIKTNKKYMINFIKNKIHKNKDEIKNYPYLFLIKDNLFEKLSDNFIENIYLKLMESDKKNINYILDELNFNYKLEDILKLFLILNKLNYLKNNKSKEELDYINFANIYLSEDMNNYIQYILENKNIKLDELKLYNKKIDSEIIDEIYKYLFNTKVYLMNKIIDRLIKNNCNREFINNVIEISLNLSLIKDILDYKFFINIFEFLKKNDIENIKNIFNNIFELYKGNFYNKKELENGPINYENKKKPDSEYKSDFKIISDIEDFYTNFNSNKINNENFDEYVKKLINFDRFNKESKFIQFNKLGKEFNNFFKFIDCKYEYPKMNKDEFNLNYIEAEDDFKKREKIYIKEINQYLELLLNPNKFLLDLMEYRIKRLTKQKSNYSNYLNNIYNIYKRINNENDQRINLSNIIHGIRFLQNYDFVEFIKLFRSYNIDFNNENE